jgi:YegS/Rv2252/BmrU family lipid kinase
MYRNKIHVIINPSSAGGKTGRLRSQIIVAIEKHLGNSSTLFVTEKPLDAERSARAAVTNGCDLVLGVGGDGTIHEIINGMFAGGHLINGDCQLGIISSGSGQGLAQSMDLPRQIDEQVQVIADGASRAIDVGKITLDQTKNGQAERHFVNECQIGIGASVVKHVQLKQKRYGGLIGYGFGSLSVLLHHPNQQMTLVIDDNQEITQAFTGISIGNGAKTAGGMQLTPEATLDDAILDVLVMREQSVLQRLQNFPKIYSGRHLRSTKFGYYKARRIDISSAEHVLVAADGEIVGTVPCTIELLPAALRVRCIQTDKESVHADSNKQHTETRV